MKYKDQKEFFEIDGKRHLLQYDREENENTYTCSIEEMYQHFKARMAEESAAIENKGMVLVDASVVRHAIFNIRKSLKEHAVNYTMRDIGAALNIIEGQIDK